MDETLFKRHSFKLQRFFKFVTSTTKRMMRCGENCICLWWFRREKQARFISFYVRLCE